MTEDEEIDAVEAGQGVWMDPAWDAPVSTVSIYRAGQVITRDDLVPLMDQCGALLDLEFYARLKKRKKANATGAILQTVEPRPADPTHDRFKIIGIIVSRMASNVKPADTVTRALAWATSALDAPAKCAEQECPRDSAPLPLLQCHMES